jgi:hypothetical protein
LGSRAEGTLCPEDSRLGRTKEAIMLKILLVIVAVLVVLWLVRTMMARSR